MKEKLKYSSGIKSKPFLYVEFKKAAELMLEHPDQSIRDLKKKTVEENIFQFDSTNRKKEVASAVFKRLKVLDDFLIDKLLNGTIDSGKQITVYSILKTDRLFFEFMNEVYKDKYQVRDPYLRDKDFNIFFQHKAEQSERVAKWVNYTYYKLKQVYIRILFEANFIKDQDEREINKPLISPELEDHLINIGDKVYLEVMLGGE